MSADYWTSGDILRVTTTGKAWRVIEPDDPNFLEIRWDWPGPGPDLFDDLYAEGERKQRRACWSA